MSTDLHSIDGVEAEALEGLQQAGDDAALEQWRIGWLGSKGRLKELMAGMKTCAPEERPAFGQRMNALKKSLEAAFKARQESGAATTGPPLDVTEPGLPVGTGRRHILARTVDGVIDVFSRMGFTVAQGPEVEDEWHNFIALNMPEAHPAREPSDNFFLDGGGMLRTQTSTVQIRVMETTPPPIRVISPGRVYRPDTHDATHYSMFHQVEGLWVDRGVTLVDLKATLFHFARTFFGPEADIRMRPSFFPFTEPSAEVDMRMPVRGKWQWVEIGGCGMVDPNVFKAVGYDPEVWTGFAFGLGIERIAMRKYGIPDIRWLFENDARFLRQF
ncbi:MAG: phenylalanine--tRNA ligase subunit alpha [Phycisphaerales bacterium]|nr:phenylalanine--tRNA ligase subunit alpha [Phycisphaerales bacterium]